MSRYYSLVSLGFVMHSRKWTTSERVRSWQNSMLSQTYSLQCKDFSSENGRGNTLLKLKSVQGQRQINTWKGKDGNLSIFFSPNWQLTILQLYCRTARQKKKKKKLTSPLPTSTQGCVTFLLSPVWLRLDRSAKQLSLNSYTVP